jgi:hypothetical protein
MSETVQRFNLNTMSGVFPGTRTMVYQRVRVALFDASSSEQSGVQPPTQARRWARVLWYDDPPSCVVELETREETEATTAEDRPTPQLVRIPDPERAGLAQHLEETLEAAGWRLITCGSCAFWQPQAARTVEGLPTGRCMFKSTEAPEVGMPTVHPVLSAQSMLALACAAWRGAETDRPSAPMEAEVAALEAIAPFRKRAEQESDERWTLVGQVRRWLRKSVPPAPAAPQTWEDRIVERSGVGAGAEPCFACQGRIANLGALVVATPEGDKQTFSVWRCRSCYTYYLNDWIDRWERTDSLETEERYYRLAPAEALEVLAVIDNVVHAEHPARRHERTAQREWMFAFVGDRPLLSHQVRQGR